METVQTGNTKARALSIQPDTARAAGWVSLAVFAAWILAFVFSILTNQVFPGIADQFIPAKIQANVLMASFSWLTQILLGTIYVVQALTLSDYLAKPAGWLVRFALIGGVIGGIFLVAAGAGGQENIFLSVFYSPQQLQELAKAVGAADLTVIAMANNIVAGGMRSTAAYATGWAMILWSAAALKTRKLPAVLCWIQIVGGLGYALTVWIGPFSGPVSFLGILVSSLWLGIFLLRVKPNE